MCGGGGSVYIPPSPVKPMAMPKTADYFYEQIKEDYGPLPSLRMASSSGSRSQRLRDVTDRRGMVRRSLLNPAGD